MNENMVDALVSQAASTNNSVDYDRLFAGLHRAKLFFNVTNEVKGTGIEALSTPLVDVGPGLKAVVFFTKNNNGSLMRPFAGITWERALEMVIKMPDADGLIIQSSNLAWVGVDKQRAKALLSSSAISRNDFNPGGLDV
jgi:hypothetical protein